MRSPKAPASQSNSELHRAYARLFKGRVGATVIALVVIVVGLILAPMATRYHAQQWTQWIIYGLLAVSFTFVWGRGGIFSFGQAAFFGIGAYGYAFASGNITPRTGESVSSLIIGTLVAALAAAIVGYFIFYGNVGDVYVAIITLAMSLVILTVMSSTASPSYHIGAVPLGGYNGIPGISGLQLSTGFQPDLNQSFAFVIIIAVLVTLGIYCISKSPLGRIMAAVKNNELRATLLGYDIRKSKLVTFTIGGGIAGLAGALFATWSAFVTPTIFGLQQAALVVIYVLVGGRASLLGAFVGAGLIEGASSALGESGGQWTPIILGGILIFVVLLLPAGIVPTAIKLGKMVRSKGKTTDEARDEARGEKVSLQQVLAARPDGRNPQSVSGVQLVKHYGGVQALRGVSVDFAAGDANCLIGPNGAGKSTFFDLLAGRVRATSGHIVLDGDDITRMRPDARARAGMGIKLQVPSYFGELSTRENIWLGAYARLRNVRESDVMADLVIRWLGLAARSDIETGQLAHGERQWVEIGMVIANQPTVLMLDEPTAGMTAAETEKIVELIHSMAHHATVIVVEHDMEFVRKLDRPVTMFHEGQYFTSGSISELRLDERVLDIYLGRTVGQNDQA